MEWLNHAEIDQVIEMAWVDRTTFEAIREQFGLEPGQVIKLMRKHLKSSSFRLWRKRTAGRTTKHSSRRQELGLQEKLLVTEKNLCAHRTNPEYEPSQNVRFPKRLKTSDLGSPE